MADIFTKEPGITKELLKRGFRFRKNVRKLMGNPDIAIQKHKIVIFLDSCFGIVVRFTGTLPFRTQNTGIRSP